MSLPARPGPRGDPGLLVQSGDGPTRRRIRPHQEGKWDWVEVESTGNGGGTAARAGIWSAGSGTGRRSEVAGGATVREEVGVSTSEEFSRCRMRSRAWCNNERRKETSPVSALIRDHETTARSRERMDMSPCCSQGEKGGESIFGGRTFWGVDAGHCSTDGPQASPPTSPTDGASTASRTGPGCCTPRSTNRARLPDRR